MMKDVEKTVGNIIDKQRIAFIGSIDSEGFPDYCVLKFIAITGRYYSNFKSETFMIE